MSIDDIEKVHVVHVANPDHYCNQCWGKLEEYRKKVTK